MAKTQTRPKEPRRPQWPADKVERRSVASLIPYARNARTHSDEQVAQIAASIKEWGWTIPVLVDEHDGIIAGHGRILAARKLNFETVPVMVARGWSEAQRRAYVIADNKLALNAGWDDELLRVEIEALQELGFDFHLTGFDDAEFAKLLEGTDGVDAAGEWSGMPEFESEDQMAFRTLPVHFKDQRAVDAFSKLIGQKLTDKTRFVWFPEAEIARVADKEYSA